jgi:hypothetical protein
MVILIRVSESAAGADPIRHPGMWGVIPLPVTAGNAWLIWEGRD